MLLASMDIWDTMNVSEEPPPSNADPKKLKEFQRRVKKAMSLTWRTTNLCTPEVVKDPRRCGRPFATFTKWRVCPRQDTRGSTLLFGGTCERWSHCYDLAQELVDVIWTLDYRYGDDANEGTYDRLCNGVFDAQDVEAQGEEAMLLQ